MAVLIAIELFSLWFAINTLSSVRALVGAEGLYSKAQKDGIYKLAQYAQTRNETDYLQFLQFMNVPSGDHITRVELQKPTPDLSKARQGFLQGRIHENDIDGMISLLRRFHNNRYISKAIALWTKGDSLISRLSPLGDSIHGQISSGNIDPQKLNAWISDIDRLNHELTVLEDNFSYTLGEGSRWLENIILKLLLSIALTVEITGLILTISVSRSISRGLNEIIRATDKIAKGDLRERAKAYSMDEIGQVATAVNKMTEQLVNSNNELGRFAYVASHDLQEPLRTISSYISLYYSDYHDKLDDNEKRYLDTISRAVSRMQLLIAGILEYSQVGQEKKSSVIDTQKLVEEVVSNLDVTIRENKVEINMGELPVIQGYPELALLFQNLVVNAIKFRKTNELCVITINAFDKKTVWEFSIADNGIGIEKKYQEQIFTLFNKLHSRKEYPGAGIGLAHALKIAEMHGGKIWVESYPGKGSTFFFTISKELKNPD
ncbi:MAG: ATP-binding protein [Nitrospira sp.]